VKSDRNPLGAHHCRIEGPIPERMFEFKTFTFPLVGIALTELPASPGAVQRDDSGRATLLHVAPGRFLAPASTSHRTRSLADLQAAGAGALFEVDGKWHTFALTGAGVRRLLSATIDLSQVLTNRECAALHLFDCPAVLALRADMFDVWVEASYASAFRQRVMWQMRC
jgi:sarcosine oxidase gamma subunit